jgi:hypothetical protein
MGPGYPSGVPGLYGWLLTPMGKDVSSYTPARQRRVANMAGIGKKIEGAAKKAAKDKISGEKKGKGSDGGGSKSGVEKAEKALKNRLK